MATILVPATQGSVIVTDPNVVVLLVLPEEQVGDIIEILNALDLTLIALAFKFNQYWKASFIIPDNATIVNITARVKRGLTYSDLTLPTFKITYESPTQVPTPTPTVTPTQTATPTPAPTTPAPTATPTPTPTTMPTGFATWNPNSNTLVPLSSDLLTVGSIVENEAILSTVGVTSGKHYWELFIGGTATYGPRESIGVVSSTSSANLHVGAEDSSWGKSTGGPFKYHSNASIFFASAISSNSTVGMMLDMDAGTLEMSVNNISIGIVWSGIIGTIFAAVSGESPTPGGGVSANFGSTPFTYTVPVGYRPGLYSGVAPALTTTPLPTQAPTLTPTPTPVPNVGDHYSAQTVLNLNFDGNLTDTSASARVFNANNGATLSTIAPRYGTGSLSLTGGQNLTSTAAPTDFAFGTGDFTIEFSAKKTANGPNGYDLVLDTDSSSGSATDGWFIELSPIRGFGLFIQGGSLITSYALNPNDGLWHDYAISRAAGTIYSFRDGIVMASAPSTHNIAAGSPLRIGGVVYSFNGFIDQIRITNSVGRYTAAYTPADSSVGIVITVAPTQAPTQAPTPTPTTAAPTAAPTPAPTPPPPPSDPLDSFVTSSIAGIVDLGDTKSLSVQTVYGGLAVGTTYLSGRPAIEFDGNTQALQLASNTSFNPGVGAFCIEAYVSSASTNTYYQILFDTSGNGSAFGGMFLEYSTLRGIFWAEQNNLGFNYINYPSAANNGTENHIFVSRDASGKLLLGYNGVIVNAKAGSVSNIPNGPNGLAIGSYFGSGASKWKGTVKGFKFTLGNSRYSGVQGDAYIPIDPSATPVPTAAPTPAPTPVPTVAPDPIWNPLDKSAEVTLSNGTSTMSYTAAYGNTNARSFMTRNTGIWYFEIKIDSSELAYNRSAANIGIWPVSRPIGTYPYLTSCLHRLYADGSVVGDIFGFSTNFDIGQLKIYRNDIFLTALDFVVSNDLWAAFAGDDNLGYSEFTLNTGVRTAFFYPNRAVSENANTQTPTGTDPYWNSVDVMINFTGAQGSSNFVDAKGHVITKIGLPVISTTVYPTGAILFTGSEYLRVNNITPFGTGDFTVETYFDQQRTSAVDPGIFQISNSPSGLQAGYANALTSLITAGPRFVYFVNNVALYTGFTSGMNHICFQRISGQTSVYLNGILLTTTPDTLNYTADMLAIGGYYSTTYLAIGPCRAMRITKGIARYPSVGFTPPVLPFPSA